MLTQKRMAEDLRPVEKPDWIAALRAAQILKLAAERARKRQELLAAAE